MQIVEQRKFCSSVEISQRYPILIEKENIKVKLV